jgi:hypothetical protein
VAAALEDGRLLGTVPVLLLLRLRLLLPLVRPEAEDIVWAAEALLEKGDAGDGSEGCRAGLGAMENDTEWRSDARAKDR